MKGSVGKEREREEKETTNCVSSSQLQRKEEPDLTFVFNFAT